MTASDSRRHRDESPVGRRASKSWMSLVAAGTAAVVTAGAIASAGGGSAGASTPISQSTGRFLSGSIAGTSLDVLAGIGGERAAVPGNSGPNTNSLNVELLNNAIQLPFQKGLQLPGLGAITLGAVSQYASAHGDGSGLGASGAVDSNGGIGVGGSGGIPTGGATIDLAGLTGAKAATDALGDVKVTIGAVSARASQVASGKTQADPNASCVTGPYSRIGGKDQAGSYNVAGLTIDLKSPLVAQVGQLLISTLGTVLNAAQTLIKALPGGLITITGFPTTADLTNDLSVSLANGSITASLADGSLHVDLAKLLGTLGLDLNKLCPNTSLLPYVATALTKLPSALGGILGDVVTKLNSALGQTAVSIAGGPPLSLGVLLNVVKPAIDQLTTAIGSLTKQLDLSALQPLIDALTKDLLDIVVNAQSESGGTLSVTALQVEVLPGGAGTLPTVPIPTLPGPAAARELKLVSAVRPLAAAPSSSAVVQLSLANATVGPNSVAPPPSSSSAPPSSSSSVPPTTIPTGVPAGQATRHDTSVGPLTIVLLLLALTFAGGGVVAFRMRGRLHQH